MLCEPITYKAVCDSTTKNFYHVFKLQKELTTDALDLSSSELKPTQPYPDSFAVKSFSIWMFEVEKSSYIACK